MLYDDFMEESTEKQGKNNVDAIRPYMWKKGQSGNILGRPKGKTMKDWAREYLARMTDEERDEWLEGVPKEVIWKMTEGNPKSEDTILVGELPVPILDVPKNNINPENTITN